VGLIRDLGVTQNNDYIALLFILLKYTLLPLYVAPQLMHISTQVSYNAAIVEKQSNNQEVSLMDSLFLLSEFSELVSVVIFTLSSRALP